jgi:hypothetical protein
LVKEKEKVFAVYINKRNMSVFCTYKRGHCYYLESLYCLAVGITLTENTRSRRIKHMKINKRIKYGNINFCASARHPKQLRHRLYSLKWL